MSLDITLTKRCQREGNIQIFHFVLSSHPDRALAITAAALYRTHDFHSLSVCRIQTEGREMDPSFLSHYAIF